MQSDSRARGPGFDTQLIRPYIFVSSSADTRRAVVSNRRHYVHEILRLVNRLGGRSLPRKSVIRLTECPDMTLAVYRGRKTTQHEKNTYKIEGKLKFKDLHALRVGRKTLKKCLNPVPDLIKDIPWEKDSIKRHHRRHHQQQPGEQQISILVVTG